MHGMINKKNDPVDIRDLLPYTYPDKEDIKNLGLTPVALGSFINWDATKQSDIIKRIGMGK